MPGSGKPSYHSMRNPALFVSVAFAVMLVLQLTVLAWWGAQKQGYHIDEIYSFENCNGYYVHKLNNVSGFANAWHDPEYFLGSLYAHLDQRFSYSTVAANVANDSSVHPPLYHLMLHTVLSLFPQTFSKWLGIVPNMLFFAVSQWFLFLIAQWFVGKGFRWLALLPCLIWGFSAGAVSMVLYIRMYAMLTMWMLGLFYCHLRIMTAEKPVKWLILAGLFAYLSFMTHYYAIVFVFFLAGCFTLLRLKRRGLKGALSYAASILGALMLMVLCWPVSITRGVIGSDRGTQAVSSVKGASLSLFADHLSAFLSEISKALFNTWMKELALAFAVLLLLLFIITLRRKAAKKTLKAGGPKPTMTNRVRLVLSDTRIAFLVLCACGLAYLVVLAVIAPYRELRYVSFLLPIIVLCFFLASKWLAGRFFKQRAVFPVALAALFCVITVSSYTNGNVLFLYPDQGENSRLIARSGCDTAVCFYQEKWRTDSEWAQFLNYTGIYCTDAKKIGTLDAILRERDYPDGIIVYLDNKTDKDSAVRTILESTDFERSEKLFTDVYFTAYRFSF